MKIFYLNIILSTLLTFFVMEEAKAKPCNTFFADSTQIAVTAKLLLNRLDEINATDKSRLSTSETKALRKELRMIKGELKELKNGTYMPAGKLVALLLVPFIIFNISQ